jgi:hypothetical protein
MHMRNGVSAFCTRPLVTILAIALSAASACTTAQPQAVAVQPVSYPPPFVRPASVSGVVLIILENADYASASKMKFLADPRLRNATLFTNYSAITHPSRPNYVAIVSGSTAGIHRDAKPEPLTRPHLGDLFEKAGKTWTVYAQNYPGDCGKTDRDANNVYVARHLGFLDFQDVQTTLCKHIVNEKTDLASLRADIARHQVPDFVMLIPDNCHNGHEGAKCTESRDGRGIAAADAWLTRYFAPLLEDEAFTRDRVFVLTFDENEGYVPKANQVLLATWGDPVAAHVDPALLDVAYNHYSLLRTFEELLGLPTLQSLGATAGDATAHPIAGIWH